MLGCNDCGVERTKQNTYTVKPKTGSPYLRSRCNRCHSAKGRQYHSKNKDACNEASRQWRKLNPDKHNFLTTAYKRHVKRATPSWLTETQKGQTEHMYFMSREAYLMTGEQYHVDHIIPLRGETVCGLHVPWNLQVLPSDLNLKKSNRTVV